MKKWIVVSLLAAVPVGCGPSAEQIADAIAEGDANSVRTVTWDLGYKVGTVIKSTFSQAATTQYFRVVEGKAPVEMYLPDSKGEGPVVTVFSNSSGTRRQHIVGRALVRAYPYDNNDIVYQTWQYLVEASSNNDISTLNTKTVTPSRTTEDKSSSFQTGDVGQFYYYQWEDWISTGNIGGVDVLALSGLIPGLGNVQGKKNPVKDEFWEGNGAIYRVLGADELSITINGKPTKIKAAKIEVRKVDMVNYPDPTSSYIESCFEWTTNSANTTTLTAPDCPTRIIAGQEWWYKNMLVKAKRTVVRVSTHPGTVTTATGPTTNAGPVLTYTRNDPGYGYELIKTCDHDEDTGSPGQSPEVSCRYFATNNSAIVDLDGFGNGPTVDFKNVTGLAKYWHYRKVTTTDNFQATELAIEEVKEVQ